jgi:hypothetical protein
MQGLTLVAEGNIKEDMINNSKHYQTKQQACAEEP